MKILITGANGQLGYHLKAAFADHELYLGDTANYDITDRELVLRETEKFNPDLIIHGAAYTNVDGAEKNRELCRLINVEGSRNVAEAAKLNGAAVVAISTDYVFAGDKGTPYTESDEPQPLSFYGQTKYEGEQAVRSMTDRHYICRTSWLYGGPKPGPDFDFADPVNPKNFVLTMLRVGRDRDQVEVVSDQKGGPTYAHDLAEKIKELVATEKYGTYHLTNSGVTNWAEFTEEIFKQARYSTSVKHLTSSQWAEKNPTTTERPKYSVLGHDNLIKAGLGDMRSWQEAIADFLSNYR